MARIKVTGYIDVDSLMDDEMDLEHEMGLSEQGYEEIASALADNRLQDIEFRLVT